MVVAVDVVDKAQNLGFMRIPKGGNRQDDGIGPSLRVKVTPRDENVVR